MHYPDLAACDYFDLPTDHLFAVGWLDPASPYAKGPVPGPFLERLTELVHEAWDYKGFMGGVWCGFCPGTLDVHSETWSSRNVFVPLDGDVYVAPEGILHYVRAHHYRPPEVFARAVLECPPQDSIDFFEAVAESGILDTSPAEAHRRYQRILVDRGRWRG